MTLDYKKLQNGSDIRGIALEGVSKESVNLGQEETERIMRGFLVWLEKKTKKNRKDIRISVGHDSRLTAEFFRKIIGETLSNSGVEVLEAGLASTPAMFMSTVFEEFDCDGAIMVTASHLPFNRNGFKFFSKAGGLDKGDIKEIIAFAEKEEAGSLWEPIALAKSVKAVPLMDVYCRFLREKIKREVGAADFEKPLKDLKIVVDAGNGAGGFFAEKILAPLGADVGGSQFLEPDGNFPNHQPNPENKEAMAAISQAVIANKADLGLIFDTDVDRSSAVDKNGREIARNSIVAMASALIALEHPNTTVVTDSITSDGLTEYLEKCLGLKHLRFKRGYKNVINKAIELNESGVDCQLAIETSGHAAYKENFFLDDGAYLATKIVIKAAQLRAKGVGIDVLISSLKAAKEAVEVRFPIEAADFGTYGEKVLEDLLLWAKLPEQIEKGISIVEPNFEGVRLNFNLDSGVKGWCLLRKSLHDPIMPLNVEVEEGSVEEIMSLIKTFLANYEGIKVE